MNTTALKTTLLGAKPAAVHFAAAAALFHSTPHLDRNKRPHWNSRCSSSSYYPKRKRKLQLKQSLLCNVNAYAEHMFQSWRSDFDDEGPPSWFKKQYGNKGSKKGRSKTQGPGFSGRRGFQFCDEDVDIENLFRAAFGGSKSHYWSFTEEIPQWKKGPSDFGSNHSSRHTWRWKTQWEDEYTSSNGTSYNSQYEDEYDSSTEADNHNSRFSSDRVALGLSASGPLKLDEIKNAYRQCALKWHPDRHQGSSKAAAEENFKKCSAAYESLCNKVPAA